MKAFYALLITLIPVVAGATVVGAGTFQSKEAGITAKGGFEVRQEGYAYTLVIQSDFQVSEGPDLYFAFHPLPAAQVTGGNAKTMALRVDPGLSALNGAQTYKLPDGFDVSMYGSLIVHCWKYNHLYAAAVLQKPAPTGIAFPQVGGRLPEKGVKIRSGVAWTRGSGRYDARGRAAAPKP